MSDGLCGLVGSVADPNKTTIKTCGKRVGLVDGDECQATNIRRRKNMTNRRSHHVCRDEVKSWSDDRQAAVQTQITHKLTSTVDPTTILPSLLGMM